MPWHLGQTLWAFMAGIYYFRTLHTVGYSLYDMNTTTVTEQPIEHLEGTDWFDRMMNELSAEAEIFNPWEDLHDLDEILGVANDDSMELLLKDFL